MRHVETGALPFLRSLGEEWKLLPPDAMQLFHRFDAIPPKARAVLFRQIENPTFPVESREVRWHPAFGPVHQEERFIKHSSRPFHESYVGNCSVGVFTDRLHDLIRSEERREGKACSSQCRSRLTS